MEIKIKFTAAENNKVIYFDAPFKNTCLAVILLGDASINSNITGLAVKSNSIFKDKFTFLTVSNGTDSFGYMAIGY